MMEVWIYFVRGAGLVKIGMAGNIERRFSSLRTASPVPLEVVAAFTGTREDEQRLHKLFREQRRHGEWFEPNDHIEDLIAETRRKFGAPTPPTWLPEHWARFAEIEIEEIWADSAVERVRRSEVQRLEAEILSRERQGHVVDPETHRRLWRTKALLGPSGLADDETLVEQAKLGRPR